MSTNRQLVIVVADDFSSTGLVALQEGLRRAPFVELHVLHVVNDDDLAKARQEWKDAIETARKKRQAKEAEEGPGKLDSADDIID